MILLALALSALLGCASPEAVDTDVEVPDSADTEAPDPFCEGVPVVDWDNFGHGFLIESCQGCHARTAPERFGAPQDVFFDTVQDAWARADDILDTVTGEDPTMPPRGGVTEDDRTRLLWWLRCGTPGS